MRCLYVYNKIDMTSIEECRRVSATPDAMVLSCRMGLNLDIFKDMLWEYLGLVRVYTKPRGKKPDVRPTRMPHGTPSIWPASPIPLRLAVATLARSQFDDPLILTDGRHGTSIESACKQVHRSLLTSFDYAMVWGTSVKHTPQRVGLSHMLQDEDVIQIVKKKGNLKELDPSNQQAAWKDPTKSKGQLRKAKAKLKT